MEGEKGGKMWCPLLRLISADAAVFVVPLPPRQHDNLSTTISLTAARRSLSAQERVCECYVDIVMTIINVRREGAGEMIFTVVSQAKHFK